MTAMLERQVFTPDDLLRMRDEGSGFELHDGYLTELNMSRESSRVAGNCQFEIMAFCHRNDLAWVFPPDTGFTCFPDRPRRLRKPDVSFVLASRNALGKDDEGYMSVVPDFVGEVISPNDFSEDVEEKIQQWLEAGVKVVWQLFPALRSVTVRNPDGSAQTHRVGDTLALPDLLPGFSVPVAALFRQPGEPPLA